MCEVIPFIISSKGYEGSKKLPKKIYDGQPVKMSSHRYQTFKRSIRCAGCGIEGRYFALERCLNQKEHNNKYHFNLYGLDHENNEILMTKDHIIPISKDGKNLLENYQTMCCLCNFKKADKI